MTKSKLQPEKLFVCPMTPTFVYFKVIYPESNSVNVPYFVHNLDAANNILYINLLGWASLPKFYMNLSPLLEQPNL